jgi:L-lactate dehydrogenase complex protein LldG
MSMTRDEQHLFTEKAQAVSAQIHVVADMQAAFAYAVELCERRREEKAGAQTNSVAPKSGSATDSNINRRTTIAAPALTKGDYALLQSLCEGRNIRIIREDLRNNLQGVDVGCTYADFGIADTGTLVINSTNEDLRLATMISDIHLAILPLSHIRQDTTALAEDLQTAMANPANFTAFITGPSRTADIERVLAIGVHGPLELHILILESAQC